MSSRTIVLLIVGVIVVFTLVSLRNYFSQAPVAEVAAPVIPRILIAKRPLEMGSFVQPMTDLDWRDVPEDQAKAGTVNENYLYQSAVSMEEFSGAVVRRALRAGEPISPSALMKSGEGGFMSAVLEPGKRAISISVTATSGNAAFISPGDRVDLMVTHRVKPIQTSK